MMKHILLLLAISFTINICAQTDFRNGKIVTKQGDTISGELLYQEDAKNAREIRFKTAAIDSLFHPFEISGYSFDNGKHYVSKVFLSATDTTEIFAEYLVQGDKDLFYYRSKSGFQYALSVSDKEIREIPYEVKAVEVDGVTYQKETKLHIGYLKSYFSDCPSLFPEIEQLKAPDRKSLISLTKKYHDITCGEGTCIVYERQKYRFRMAIEPVYSFYLKNNITEDGSLSAIGGHVYFWIPNSSEKLFIKTGLLFAQPKGYNYYQIPFQISYVFDYNMLRPKFDAGVNWHINDEGGVVLTTLVGGGCLVKLTNWMYADFDVSSDLFTFSYETEFFITFALRAGLYFTINN